MFNVVDVQAVNIGELASPMATAVVPGTAVSPSVDATVFGGVKCRSHLQLKGLGNSVIILVFIHIRITTDNHEYLHSVHCISSLPSCSPPLVYL